ncbi:MAG: tyrosine--tRNA ligase [Solirubrobacterales bacterium]
MAGKGDRNGSATAEEAGRLAARSVESLPEGRLEELLETGEPLRIKLGIDPTAPDLHLGHCVVLDKLREFQDAGHQVVLIVGDFTAKVGDPSGLSSERPVLTPEEIQANAETFAEQAFKILDPDKTEVRFNSEWLDMSSSDLLRLLSTTTVAQLLEREDFRNRMSEGKPVSAMELLYPLLQGYDSVAIDADVELGGTDQTFNLLFGREVQGAFGKPQQVVMTLPILPGTDGVERMSKSLGNYVAVNDPPEEKFGKLMSIPDSALPEYRALLLKETEELDAVPNVSKRDLARRVVDRFHGEGSGQEAEASFDRLFVKHEIPDDVPEYRLGHDDEVHLPAVVSDAFGVSRSEARRVIGQGGLRLEGEPLPADRFDFPPGELDGRVLQFGKRHFVRFVHKAD